ncbi:uncharacterized protein LOC144145162 [Haemaphysalis longicornis]
MMSSRNRGIYASAGSFALTFFIVSVVFSEALQPMRWCGGPLNPWEAAKAARIATGLFLSCKDETIALNIKPSIIKETTRGCAAYRICFAVAEDNRNTTATFFDKYLQCLEKLGKAWTTGYPWVPKKYNIDTDEAVAALRRCGKIIGPGDLIYVLKTVEYFKDFVTG